MRGNEDFDSFSQGLDGIGGGLGRRNAEPAQKLNDTLKKPTPRSNGLRQGFGSQELRGMIKFSQPFEGTDRGRQADALKLAADRHQPLDRGDQVYAPFVADHGVNFVENDRWTKGREFVDRW